MTDNAKLIEDINALRRQRNAVILVHNYQLGEVQDIADFVGDSFEVIKRATETTADVVVLCGVHFMAETASILRPEKVILLPDANAGCPMASMITAKELREKKKEYPKAIVVCYVNSPAEVKAESDVCCTAGNAVKVVQGLDSRAEILFVPDRYLGDYVATQSGRDLILWPGYCPTHVKIMPEDIAEKKAQYPQAQVAVHPECIPAVRAMADAVVNTGGFIRFAGRTEVGTMIVGTETGILHRLRKEYPHKTFIPATDRAVCGKMKRIRLETVLWSLTDLTHRVQVSDRIRKKAVKALDRMLAVAT